MKPKRNLGTYIQSKVVDGESFQAYVPPPLPPQPGLDMSRLQNLLDQAHLALGQLNGAGHLLKDPDLFIYSYIRKEAVLSSQIEGTQSSLSDLIKSENEAAPGVPNDEVAEVSSCVRAIKYGLESELPVSLRLIRELHARLMDQPRGRDKQPGEFRRSQNWIGGSRPGTARFVPPPHEQLMNCLDPFEKFLHSTDLPVLIKTALAHVQFESIHPFLDGNGRVGRLLIIFMLWAENILHHPLLYLSLYFKQNRQQYYDHLQAVRLHGAWEEWVEFFLTGVVEVAQKAGQSAQEIIQLFRSDGERLQESKHHAQSLWAVYKHLQRHPVVSVKNLKLDMSPKTIGRHMATLEKLGLVHESTGKQRHRVFVYTKYLEILNSGTEL